MKMRNGYEGNSASVFDVKYDYEAKKGVLCAGAPKVLFRYYSVNSTTSEMSGIMLADAICASGTTLCGSQNFFDDRGTLQFTTRKYLSHMIGNILLGAVEKRSDGLLTGPDS